MRLLVLLLLLPIASAQGPMIVEVNTWVTPDEYFLPISVHPNDIPSATLHVQGEIQCQPGMEAPEHVSLNYAGSTIVATISGEQLIYAKVDLGDFNVTWSPKGGNLYAIDETYEVPLLREAVPDQDMQTTHRWDDVFEVPQGTLSCDPQGYFWDVNDQYFNLTVEGFGDTSSDGFKFPSKETPAPFGLALLALIGLAFKKRE
jgi:hypothetical protein